jgi:hypothetical protein
METFLTLAIAVGGIATGIGAIWAAVVARRQADLTARSLAQTERSLAEQNERSRLHLEAEWLFKFDDRWKSPLSLTQRRSAAKYLIENAFLDNDPVELPHLSDATEYVCGFFEMVGHFQSLGAMQAESVWHEFGAHIRYSWMAYGLAIEKAREELNAPTLYKAFERLNDLMANIDREQGVPDLTQEQLRKFFKDQTVLGDKPGEVR